MEGQLIGISQKDSQPRLWMTMGKVVSKKSDEITWCFEWMPRFEKFSEKSWRAFSSWNQTEIGLGSEDDALERKGFWDRADLCLGAMCRLRERERDRQTDKKAPINSYTKKREKNGMYAWSCDVQQEYHHGLNPIQTYQHTRFQHRKHTSIMLETLLKMKIKCNALAYSII